MTREMLFVGPEITKQHQTNDLCYPETSFLRVHARRRQGRDAEGENGGELKMLRAK